MFLRLSALLLSIFILSCKTNEISTSAYSRQELKKRTFDYFWNVIDTNFQTLDRYPTKTFSSIAATGFALSSYIIGIENTYITRTEGAERVHHVLKTLWNLPQGPDSSNISGHQGFFYHFLTLDKAVRFKNVELSSIDTGLLMAGILSCLTYFDGENDIETEIRQLADQLYLRVNWNWMMKPNGVMSMGWHPEKGFLESEWSGYNEAMILLVLGLGSPTHPIPNGSWQKWCATYQIDTFYNQKFVQFDPLFGHQYSHLWIDFRGIKDSIMTAENDDYFENSKKATLSNRAYCIHNPMQWEGYSEIQWGLTACDGPAHTTLIQNNKERQFFDYRARGAASIQIVDDGTIAPTAAGGSFPFTPTESEACLKNLWERYYSELIGEYGFKDAFNLSYKDENNPNGWFDIDYLGIDQGPILIQIENYETGLLWNIMKKNTYIQEGLKKAGFSGGWLNDISNQ
ncbi:MAG: Tat pathway signal protein [Lewinellaceae bacterium]|nr:Tat pathway signal protein [Lewinellaceae bacterium]